MIKTERLIIKPIENNDEVSLISLLKNEKVNASYLTPDLTTDTAAKKLFDRIKELSETPDRFARGIYLNDQLIGIINDTGIDGNVIEIGYAVHPDHQNKGYATEAVKAVISKLLDKGYTIIRAGIFEDNNASRRVLEKSGMSLIDMNEKMEYKGKIHHCLYFELRG